MTYDALDIAAYVVQHCHETGTTVSNLKLQKILYFLQAEFLVNKDECCFFQHIEAWSFGPVVPEVYHEYKIYGGAAIPYVEDNSAFWLEESDKKRINRMIDKCSKYSASDLVQITHRQSPWIKAYSPRANKEITTSSIRDFFKKD